MYSNFVAMKNNYPLLLRGINKPNVPALLVLLLFGLNVPGFTTPNNPPEKPAKVAATFTVTNLDDAGPGSLRAAIISANASPGFDVIEFTVGGTIELLSELPALTDECGFIH